MLARLASAVGCSDTRELFERHTVDVLASMSDSYALWTQHSTQRLLFDAVLLEAGHTHCLSLDSPSQLDTELWQMLKHCLQLQLH